MEEAMDLLQDRLLLDLNEYIKIALLLTPFPFHLWSVLLETIHLLVFCIWLANGEGIIIQQET
jgi:hypothetical protein